MPAADENPAFVALMVPRDLNWPRTWKQQTVHLTDNCVRLDLSEGRSHYRRSRGWRRIWRLRDGRRELTAGQLSSLPCRLPST